MATEKEVQDFIRMMAPIAQRQSAAHQGKIYPSVCIAQACCESAYGTSPKMKRANAVFGIKVGSMKQHFGAAWKDKAYSTKTKECYDGKTYAQITDMFRAYDSIEDSTEDYFDMLCAASRYRHALGQPTPRKCIEGIQKAPYATSPTYVSTIMSIINKYKLTQYDAPCGSAENLGTGEYAVTASTLNIRREANADSDDIGDLASGSVITVDDVSGNWGHFGGWVNLRYARRV